MFMSLLPSQPNGPPRAPAERLARALQDHRNALCERVAARHLAAFPELAQTLRHLPGDTPQERIRTVAVDQLHTLIVATLTFGAPSLAENEYRWSGRVLPRSGVRQQHQIALVRAYAAEAHNLPLDSEERATLNYLVTALISIIQALYPDR